ncbi:MAG: TRAP transporter substrate-binding protein DctP [Spirochaetaceae bacterium]|nr:TRAP transporter substrate-binding protein DctP [Spirochaetaceae bacterium]
MTRRNSTILAIAVLACACEGLGAGAQSLTLKMAANVPANSPWDLGLKRLAAEIDKASGGTVKIAFPQSVRVSTESDIIQKMNLGIDGALLTTYGLAELYPDSLALSMPSLIRDDAEFDAVLAAIEPLLRTKLGDKYVVLAASKGGWVRYFSRSSILYPSDLAKLRVSVDPAGEKVMRILQSAGARTVKGDISAFLLQLNSNSVDAAFVSPIFIASLWSQLRGKIAYMSPFKVSPFIGAIVFNKSSWEKVPASLRPRLEEILQDMSRLMGIESAKLEDDAIAAMVKDGLKVPALPADADSKWTAFMEEKRDGIISSMFSQDILDTIYAALASARNGR